MCCSMTGVSIRDSGDGIWDDGEWISWAYLNEQMAAQTENTGARTEFASEVQPYGPRILTLIKEAVLQEKLSPGPSPLWGRIGELYVAERFGVVLSRSHAQGHDGRLGREFVEIKTITPHKRRAFVRVKRTGNYSLLAVVRVNEAYQLDARLIRRDQLAKGAKGKFATLAWSAVRQGRHPGDITGAESA